MVRKMDHTSTRIKSFRCRETKKLFETGSSLRFKTIEAQATLKLDQLDTVSQLSELAMPPGNQLKALKGDRLGQFSIRINKQWRLCFSWTDEGPINVEIVDYH